MLLCCASLCCTSTMIARLAARCAPFAVPPAVGRGAVFMYSPCRAGPQPLPSDAAMQARSCDSTLIVASRVRQGHITSEQLAAACAELVQHTRRSVAQPFLGILGMLETHACSTARYWKTCFAACFARKSRIGKRTSGDCVDCSQFRWGKHDWRQTWWKLPANLTCSSAFSFPIYLTLQQVETLL